MAEQVTIVASDVTDEVVEWLKAQGVEIEGFGLCYSCAKKGTLTVVTTTAMLNVAFCPSAMGKPYLHFEIGVRITKKSV